VGCLTALASFGDLRAIGLAVRHLRDGVARLPAADVLRAFGLAAAPTLAQSLSRRELVHGAEPPTWAAARCTAAELLGELALKATDAGTREALIAPLQSALGDEAPEVRRAAALALAPLGSKLAARPNPAAAEPERRS
jgi:HEAT repeat protein